MASYLSPGVYIEDIKNAPVIGQSSTSTGGFIGVSQRGAVGVPQYLSSWGDYVNAFAYGMDSPFIPSSDLAYAVYGFFLNGGTHAYVIRTATTAAAVATATFTGIPEDAPVINAKDEGVWGNALTVNVAVNEDNISAFDLTVSLSGEVVEQFVGVNNTDNDANFWIDVLRNRSNFIKGISGTLAVPTAAGTFAGGVDGTSGITDADYTKQLSAFDNITDVNFLAIPGQTSPTVHSALLAYGDNRKDVFSLVEAPVTASVSDVRTLRKTTSANAGALFYPWIKVADPLSPTGKLRNVPPTGHVMGVYARIIEARGVWKAPAGTEANIRGAVDVTTVLSDGDISLLNPIGVIPIVPKTNYGIVVWGARNLSSDSSMKYVSDDLLDIYIKKSVKEGTQSFVFEPNDPTTWTRVVTTIQTFLDGLWRAGALFGNTAAQAYFVKCDADLNPESSRDEGNLIIEVGYAGKKPAEFVIFRFVHSVPSSN